MGGSGGGSSGAVSYPAYMQTIHGLWLNDAGVDVPANSLVDAINEAYAANPFVGVVTFNPDTLMAEAAAAVTSLNTLVDAMNYTGDFNTAYSNARTQIVEEASTLDSLTVDNARVTADIVAFDAILADRLENEALPQFRAGMLNIGAVHSSAFVIGEAIIRAYKQRDLAKYGSELRVRLQEKQDELNARFMLQRREIEANHKIRRGELVHGAVVSMLQMFMKRHDLEGDVARLTIESRRIHAVAKKEQIAEQADFDEKEGLWRVELFGHAGNLLAGPGGGTTVAQKRPNKATSAIGGALSGAAAGAMLTGGNPYGIAAGAVIGAGLALAS